MMLPECNEHYEGREHTCFHHSNLSLHSSSASHSHTSDSIDHSNSITIDTYNKVSNLYYLMVFYLNLSFIIDLLR